MYNVVLVLARYALLVFVCAFYNFVCGCSGSRFGSESLPTSSIEIVGNKEIRGRASEITVTTLRVANRGNRVVQFESDIPTSCGCLTAKLGKYQLSPNEETDLELRTKYTGSSTKDIDAILTESNTGEQVAVRVSVRYDRIFGVVPSYADVNVDSDENAIQKAIIASFYVSYVGQIDKSLVKVITKPPFVADWSIGWRENSGTLNLTISPSELAKLKSGKIIVGVENGESWMRSEVNIQARCSAYIRIEPSEIHKDARVGKKVRVRSTGAQWYSHRDWRTHLGNDGCFCWLWLPQGPCRFVCQDLLAFRLVQGIFPGRIHGGCACQLGRVL